MSHQDKKQETATSIANLLLPAGAIAITIFGMLFISFSVILFTGIFFGGNQAFEAKVNLHKKNSGIVIILSSTSMEDEIRKSHLDTPELPLHFRSQKQLSLLNSQLAYRY